MVSSVIYSIKEIIKWSDKNI